MAAIDKDLFEFQMRLVRAEIERDNYKERFEEMKSRAEAAERHFSSHMASSREYDEAQRNEIRSLNEYIARFIVNK